MDWDTIAVAAILIEVDTSGSTFNFDLIRILEIDVDGPGSPWDTGDDDAEVEGDVELTAGHCYIILGGHGAFEFHVTESHISWWGAFSFSRMRCA